MRFKFAVIFASACSLIIYFAPLAFAAEPGSPFLESSSDHFRVRFSMEAERDTAQSVLRQAEAYYIKIAEDIGYSRYEDFWTWDRRVVIMLYPDQYAYARFTGSPSWSKGFASRDTRVFKEHAIVSYDGQQNFLDEVLPHEIAHLMLWDYIGAGSTSRMPVWFEEGVAQLEEKEKSEKVFEAMRPLVLRRGHIPFSSFGGMTVTGEGDPQKVSLFYAQSLSIVLFLIQKYGKDSFYRLCAELRSGSSFEVALDRAYPSVFGSFDTVESRWVRYFDEQ